MSEFVPINMDFGAPVKIDVASAEWIWSPGGQVERRMLERERPESGHTTSIVRYPAGSKFPEHVHSGGEEYLVLEGVFSDEHGDYPPGTYVRNPIGSNHSPFSDEGCVIFVKLWQMGEAEEHRTLVRGEGAWDAHGPGLSRRMLYVDEHEEVTLLRAEAAVRVALSGAEALVVTGEVRLDEHTYGATSWLRAPVDEVFELVLTPGSVLWLKCGHLG